MPLHLAGSGVVVTMRGIVVDDGGDEVDEAVTVVIVLVIIIIRAVVKMEELRPSMLHRQ